MPGTHRAAVRSPRRWLITAVVVGLVAALVGPVGANGDPGYTNGEYPLFAGQDIPVGTIFVTNDDDTIFVEYDLDAPWCMTESHVEVFTDDDGFTDVPHKNGNPIPGQFESKMDHDCVTTYTHEIDFAGTVGTEIYIAAHAEVWNTSSVAEVTFSSADMGEMTGFGRFNDYDTAKTSTVSSLIRTLLESEENGAWDDSIGAPWVTIDNNANPDVDQWFRVDHDIVVDGLPLGDGYVEVNADNADEVLGATLLPGSKPGAVTGTPIRPAHDQTSEYSFPVTEGGNTVQFIVRNYFPTTLGSNNPMALTYSGSVEYYDTEESAWAATEVGHLPFPGKNWATYVPYTWMEFDECPAPTGTGFTVVENPGTSLLKNQLVNPTAASLIEEGAFDGASYTTDDLTDGSQTSGSGDVCSWYLHIDRGGSTSADVSIYDVDLTFMTDVVGVQVRGSDNGDAAFAGSPYTLNDTTFQLGPVTYPTHPSSFYGLEWGDPNDKVTVSGRDVAADVRVNGVYHDVIRILVEQYDLSS